MPIQQLSPKHCFDLCEVDPSIIHLDVRTPHEFASGHAAGAYNVPVFVRGGGGLSPNPSFLTVALRLTSADARVILSCAMGGRSQRAAEQLEAAGHRLLINMTGGFSGERAPDGGLLAPGWADLGLPISTEVGERAWEVLRKG